MCDFMVGDRVAYTQYDVDHPGLVTAIDHEAIVVTCDGTGSQRAFQLNGRGRGNDYRTQSGIQYATVRATLKLIERSATGYPPEPEPAFGVFTSDGRRMVPPGYSGETLVGYGILNLPPRATAAVTETQENPYFETARTLWTDQCLAIDFDRVPNKWELMIGVTIQYVTLSTDEIVFDFRIPGHDYIQARFSNPDCISYGLKTRDEITRHIHGHAPTITAIDGEIIHFEDGFAFGVTSRMAEGTPFGLTLTGGRNAKAILMRSMAERLAAQDSTLTEPIRD